MQLLLVWIAAFALYLLFAGQASAPELVAAVLTAAVVTAYQRRVQRLARRKLYLAAPWGWLALRIPLALLRDTGLVGWGLIRTVAGRPRRGGLATQPFDPGGFTPPAAGHRALAVLAASAAPNGYVIEVLESPQGLLMHRLVPQPPAADRRWPV